MLWCSLSCRALQNFPPISLTAIRIHRCPVFKKEGIPYEKNSHGKQIPNHHIGHLPAAVLPAHRRRQALTTANAANRFLWAKCSL